MADGTAPRFHTVPSELALGLVGTVTPTVKREGRQADHSLPSSADV